MGREGEREREDIEYMKDVLAEQYTSSLNSIKTRREEDKARGLKRPDTEHPKGKWNFSCYNEHLETAIEPTDSLLCSTEWL